MNTKHLISMMALSTVIVISCQTESKTDASSNSSSGGEQLYIAYCGSCHAGHSGIAPPTFNIQKHYRKDHPEEADFVAAISSFVRDPNSEKAKLKHAVDQFGVMPAMQYDDVVLEAIGKYIFQAEFDPPGHHGNQSDQIDLGARIARGTKKQLGKNLLAALDELGTIGALEFCNENAVAITDSMSNVFEAQVKRVSDQPRNPDNQANTEELKHIAHFKNQLNNGLEMEPIIVEESNFYRFYAPITTNQMCLQCHGTVGNQISPEVKSVIDERYPDDKATGYAENQIRGIWSIQFSMEDPSSLPDE